VKIKTCIKKSYVDIPATKYYKYHGLIMPCNIQPDPECFEDVPTDERVYPILSKTFYPTSVFSCGEAHWPPNLFNPSDVLTCDHNMVKDDDSNYLYAKTRWWVGNGQASYNTDSFLKSLKHKVVAIQSITVYMVGDTEINVPGTHYSCGPSLGKLYTFLSYTAVAWQGLCISPGFKVTHSFEYEKVKPPLAPERNWDMEYAEELAKPGFRVDQATEDDPDDYGLNRTKCYWNYKVIKYKKTYIETLPIQDPEWDVWDTGVLIYGNIHGGGHGYFIRGFQIWKWAWPTVITESAAGGTISSDEYQIFKVFNGLDPDTDYQYRAILRNTGTAADTIFGRIRDFKTKV